MISVLVVVLLVAGCSSAPAAVQAPFVKVELPAGAVPSRIAANGGELVVGVRVGGKPGMLRYEDGHATEIPLKPATGYGAEALWYSVAVDSRGILAVGGKTGGAHGNVRWSVWRTSGDGLVEQPQAFSTFGGVGGGALVDGVLPTTGPLLVGSWVGATVSLDPTIWTTNGTDWIRRSSAGTALQSTLDALKFPMAAAAHGADVVIVGWQMATGKQQPVVWTLRDGVATLTTLPDAGRAGMATSVTCADTCAVAGRVDGRLAVWRGSGNAWRRVADVPNAPVGDDDRPAPPLGDTLVYSDRGTVRVATLGGDDIRDAAGPTGVVTAVARVGDTTYVLAGPDDDNLTLWRAGRN